MKIDSNRHPHKPQVENTRNNNPDFEGPEWRPTARGKKTVVILYDFWLAPLGHLECQEKSALKRVEKIMLKNMCIHRLIILYAPGVEIMIEKKAEK